MQARTLKSQLESARKTQCVLGGVLVVLALLFYYAGYRPASQKLEALEYEASAKGRTLEADQLKANHLPVVAAEVARLRQQLEQFDKKLPSRQELGRFIMDITQVVDDTSLRKLTYKPGVPKRSELFGELPIQLNFEGDFLSVCSFLQQTEGMQRLTRVRDINIKSTDTKQGQVEVQLSMNIYFSEG